MVEILNRRIFEDPYAHLAFPEWLRAKREEQGWTQETLAGMMGYDTSMIGKVERGQRQPTKEFQRIARNVLE